MENKIQNIRAKDPLDILIQERGLRIKSVVIDKELDIMILLLTNRKVIKSQLSVFPRLHQANQKQLNKFRLISNGIGIHWEELDEDISLKGLIKNAAINTMIKQLQENEMHENMELTI